MKRAMERGRLSIRRGLVGVLLALSLCVAAPPAWSDDYDSTQSAHPLRIAAYLLHPVGVILDTLIVRPAHWIMQWEPFKTLIGHTDE